MESLSEDASLNFIKVNGSDDHIEVLFDLIKLRTHPISHNNIPSMDDHKKFVINHPYREWFLIKKSNTFVGTLYITNENFIGLNLVSDYKGLTPLVLNFVKNNYLPLEAIPSVRAKGFYINIAPSNNSLLNYVVEMGGHLVQSTYKI